MTLTPTEPVDLNGFKTTWPMAAERCELVDGAVVWWGKFTHDDRVRAERAFPEHQVTLDGLGNIWLEHRKRDELYKELRSELRRGEYALH